MKPREGPRRSISAAEAEVPAKRSLGSVLGPGIIYAAAAVGISHLVQATRAGADYGLGLMLVVIVACAIKYPSLRFGSDYAAATGESLIASYRAESRWAFGIYALSQIFSMVFVVAAIALFTLGLIQAAFGFAVGPVPGVAILLTLVAVLLVTGHYTLLERFSKYVVAIFTVLILAAVAIVAGRVEWSFSVFAVPRLHAGMVLYIAALVGFMPTPTDGSVLQSLWTCARGEARGALPSLADSRLDFNIGYLVSVFLALCFLVMGAGIMHGPGVEIVSSNVGFSEQLMSLFTEAIGSWSFPLIATAVISVTLSTLFTVVDGMSRVAVGILETVTLQREVAPARRQRRYNLVLAALCAAAVVVLATMLTSFTTFIDLTSIIVFGLSPLIALLNHRAMWSKRVPAAMQPNRLMKLWSLGSVVALLVLALSYFYFRFAAH